MGNSANVHDWYYSIENRVQYKRSNSTSMLWRNTDIWLFSQTLSQKFKDKRNYMMKYEPWRFDGTRLTICHDATKHWPFKKMHVYWPWTTRDISIALSWHVQLSTNLTDKSVKINKVKYLSQYMYTTIKYWLNRISTSWCWLSYHLLFGGRHEHFDALS